MACLGHNVTLIDPEANNCRDSEKRLSGTAASLGILMGRIYNRSKGRAWELRKRSIELWPEWIKNLNSAKNPLFINTPLVKFPKSEKEANTMNDLAKERYRLGLEMIKPNSNEWLKKFWPNEKYGCLISHKDGFIDPLKLQICFREKLLGKDIHTIHDKVLSIERGSNISSNKWHIHLENGKKIKQDVIVICAALASEKLIKPLGYSLPLEPILGQAIKLKLCLSDNDLLNWPSVINYQRINLIKSFNNEIILGATLEKGIYPNLDCLNEMQNCHENAPAWLKQAKIDSKWFGIRARPLERPAPILDVLENGLIISTGHYRNGILLAPASAEWVGKQIS